MLAINRARRRAFFGHDKQVEKKAQERCNYTTIKEVRGLPVKITLDISIENLGAVLKHFQSYEGLIENYMEWTVMFLNNSPIFNFDNQDPYVQANRKLLIKEKNQKLLEDVLGQLSLFSEVFGVRVGSVDLRLLDV